MMRKTLYLILIFTISVSLNYGKPYRFSNYLPKVVKGKDAVIINVSTLSRS